MLESLPLLHDVDGLPRVTSASPVSFFESLEAADARRPLCTWSGELYLELHQGTLTSQADGKLGNRLAEGLLHAVEALGVLLRLSGMRAADSETAHVGTSEGHVPGTCPASVDAAGAGSSDAKGGDAAAGWSVVDDVLPLDVASRMPLLDIVAPTTMQRIWERVLLCQFHDALPGSSIAMVRSLCVAVNSRVGCISSRTRCHSTPTSTGVSVCGIPVAGA
jgi:hypothetical protein